MQNLNAKLDISNLNAYYGKALVLHHVSIEVNPGEKIAILGRNGMGKTTLLKALMGLDKVRVEGSARYGDVELTKLPTYGVARQGIAYVPQGWQLFRSLSVEEHLVMAYRKANGTDEWTPERVLNVFPDIGRRRKIGGTRLSGGEQQILAIGRALVANTNMLLMDEPSEGVSTMVLERVRDICFDLSAQGKSILLVEQNLSLALKIAQRVYILVNGEIVHSASAEAFSADRK
ncbi:MAG: ABC transporter ATP-binding protein, partial [Clostridia bacterium]